MPWTPKTFAKKHNKKLHGAAAKKAAEQATAMVKSGVPEGIAIATANKTGNRMQHRKGAVDRSSHHKGNPGFPSTNSHSPPVEAMKIDKIKVKTTYKPSDDSKAPPKTYAHHEAREREVLGSTYQMHEAAFHHPKSVFPGTHSRAHGYGHGVGQRKGHLRNSGHPGAHRIGKK